MRILVIQETDWLDRGPHQQHHLFERLSARGHEVTVLDFEMRYTPWPKTPLIQQRQVWPDVARLIEDGPVRVIRPGTLRLPVVARLLSVPAFYFEVRRQLRQFRPDIVVDYALSTGLPAWIANWRSGVPFLMHVIDALYTLAPQPAQPVARLFEQLMLPRTTHTLYINNVLREYGIAMGADPQTATVIGSGVDLGRFRPDLPTAELRAHWGLAEDDVVLLFIGWLYEFAGIDTIMRVLPDLPPQVKLLVVGEGDAGPRLRALCQSLELGERVIFTGRQPYELAPQFMALADVCLLFSEVNEVMRHIVPIKTFEYMASGSPVLASQLPGVMGDVPPGNGILYAAPDELLSTLHRLLDADLRAELGRQGRAFAEAHCDWERLTDAFEALLRQVAKS